MKLVIIRLSLLLYAVGLIFASPDPLLDDDLIALLNGFESDQEDKEDVATDQEDEEDIKAYVAEQEDEDDKDGVLADIEAMTTLLGSTKELESARAMDENIARSQYIKTLFHVGKSVAKRYLRNKYCKRRRCNQEEEEEIEVQEFDDVGSNEDNETRLIKFQTFLENLKKLKNNDEIAEAEFWKRIKRWARKKWRGARRWVRKKWRRARKYIKRRGKRFLWRAAKKLFKGAVRKYVC